MSGRSAGTALTTTRWVSPSCEIDRRHRRTGRRNAACLHSERALSSATAGHAEGASRMVARSPGAPHEALLPAATGHSESARPSAARGAPEPGIRRRRSCARREARRPDGTDRRWQRRGGHDDARCGCGHGDSGPVRCRHDASLQNARSSLDGRATRPRMCQRTDSSPSPTMSALSETRPYCSFSTCRKEPTAVSYEALVPGVGPESTFWRQFSRRPTPLLAKRL
jgi:hypothetical protein